MSSHQDQNKERIWIVEDDPGMQFVYREILGGTFELSLYGDLASFRAALRAPAQALPRLIIADIGLPDGSFLSFLGSGESTCLGSIAFIIVTSLDDLNALRVSFARGAVDYITKPFGKAELMIKVERILSVKSDKEAKMFTTNPTSLTVSTEQGKSSMNLTPKEFQIVAILEQAAGHRILRDELIARVWGEVTVTSKTLDVHLANLRKKLLPLGLELVHIPPNWFQLNSKTTQL